MSRVPERHDLVIVGGGVLGLALACEAHRRRPEQRILVLEKEEACGLHASGRNSGVLHAGFYYATDSLKARFTVRGNREMKDYCRRRGLPLNECGKLVVARDASELDGLEELLRRGRANGVELEPVSEARARRIEPRVKTHGRALFSPSTATVDPRAVVRSLASDARERGIEVRTGTAYRGRRDDGTIATDAGPVDAGYVVNAAGLHADRVARDFGFSERYRILPFKGLYLHSSEPEGSLTTNIYPVPALARPFLGVHFTVTVDGRTKIGPTAVPALWREHYRGLAGFDPAEAVRILWREARLFAKNAFGFRDLALEELRKYHRPTLVRRAAELAEDVRPGDYTRWGRPGIRAQLLDVERDRLVMDFVWEGDAGSFHVLNAVSPGFTCALPFARFVLDRVDEHRR